MAFYSVKIVGVPLEADKQVPFNMDLFSTYCPPDRQGVTRYFCPTCSAHMLVKIGPSQRGKVDAEEGFLGDPRQCDYDVRRRIDGVNGDLKYNEEGVEWRVAGGALNKSEGIVKPMYHLHVASTMDGGMSDVLRVVEGVELPRYSEGYGSPLLPLKWRSPELKEEQPRELDMYCHCGTISVKISPPEEIATEPRAPFPDLLYPADVTRLAKQRNPGDVKWWLRPPYKEGEHDRYLAGYCACSYCRASSGFEFQPWGFVIQAYVRESVRGPDEPIEFPQDDLRPQGLKQYASSPGRYREFCAKCGATAFWWTAGRPDIIDVSMGLINQSYDGVRAEHWFQWHKDRVSFAEKATSPVLVQALGDGLKAFY
ncbi:hypothetical protein H1R20_g4029, partial [Candolleomyces eurysporus]